MSPKPDATSAAEWLERARGDLAFARAALPPEGYWERLCLDAQQAAEKALKAIYIARGVEFDWTHNISVLMKGLEAARISVPPRLGPAKNLTGYAYTGRYPGVARVTEADRNEAVRIATAVVAWAEAVINGE